MTGPRSGSGVSLLEMLVALALAMVLALLAGRLLEGGARADAGDAAASDGALALSLAASLLSAEVRRAGYRPSPGTAASSRDPSGPALTAEIDTGGAGSDSLELGYIDDRLAAGAVVRRVRFEVGVDARGAAQLYRVGGAGSRQPLVQGVTRLRLIGWADVGGLHRRSELKAGPFAPWLLVLRLEAGRRRTSVAVALPSRPLGTVRSLP